MYRFQEFYIPDRMMPGIKRYIEEKVQPGHFLTAVIQNDLSEACARADDENMRNLPAYAAYLYNHAPMSCHGSKKAMKLWLESKKVNQQKERTTNHGRTGL